uniref:ATP synthase peripheral stalk subunit F6, mitochondrial n=1 Tax=Sinocyclocheilus anshuiensis TaxID=1608454 RepID=A0A671PYM2_9TELE
MASPEASSAHENGHLQEFSDVSGVVAVTNASTLVNVAQSQDSSQPQSTQVQGFLAPTWSSNVKADKPSSGQEIITQALVSFTDGTANSIPDISSAEAVAVASDEVPTLREVCREEAIQVSSTIPEVSSPQSTEHLPVVETTSASLSKAVDAMSEMSGISLTSVAQLDPIQKLFLDKIREYSTKSQASGGPVDAGPEYEKAFSEELNKLQRLYGSGDLTEFPEFKFSEPELNERSSK